MLRLCKQIIKSEKGQALPIVLVLLVSGGLMIVPSLNFATTSLNAGRIIGEGVNGIYAADAGMEEVLWSLGKGMSPATQLSENINGMAVTMQTEERGTYTQSFHNDYLRIDGEMIWDEEVEAYKYTLTVYWQPGSGVPTIHLVEVGVKLPGVYSYQAGSSANFTENLSTDEPDETLDERGAYLLNWEFGSPLPSVSDIDLIQTQTFYITGEGGQESHYSWVTSNREDIGTVSEITGTSYQLSATATRPEDGHTTAAIVADVMIGGGITTIVSWQVTY